MSAGLQSRPLPGRILALLGILLVAINVRTAVSSLSPIVERVSAEVPLDELGLGIIGMLPPVAFAVSAIAAPIVARRLGIELSMALACVAMVAGPILRASAGSYGVLVAGSALALAGMGFGNVLLPPAVKKYFPDRIGVLTAAYVTLLAISTAVAAALAEPVAATAGWRLSLGMWAALAAVALAPWVILLLGKRRMAGDEVAIPETHFGGQIWRSGVARSLALLLIVTAFATYSMFAWLPTLIADQTRRGAGGGWELPRALQHHRTAARARRARSGCPGAESELDHRGWCDLHGGVLPRAHPAADHPARVVGDLRRRRRDALPARTGAHQPADQEHVRFDRAQRLPPRHSGDAGGALGLLVIAATHDATDGWTVPLLIVMAVTLLGLINRRSPWRSSRYMEDQLAPAPAG